MQREKRQKVCNGDDRVEKLNDRIQQHSDNIADDQQADQLDEETEKAIADYQSKIEELDERINKYRTQSITDKRRQIMRDYYYTDKQIDRYIDYIKGDDETEIKRSVIQLIDKIPPAGDNTGDPNAFNPARQKSQRVDTDEIGRSVFERIKHKIFPGRYSN